MCGEIIIARITSVSEWKSPTWGDTDNYKLIGRQGIIMPDRSIFIEATKEDKCNGIVGRVMKYPFYMYEPILKARVKKLRSSNG